jgi:hemerythrin-like domain-containing protein
VDGHVTEPRENVMSHTRPVDRSVVERPNIQEMYVVHRVFRRELTLLPELIRGVHEGDTKRARLVGAHLRLILDGLHMHHTGEDEVLWPRLLDRAAPSAVLVRTMQAQHEQVDVHLDRLDPLLRTWMSTAAVLRGEQVARVTDELRSSLLEHLDLEEREILPLVFQHITVAEWNSLGEHGRSTIPARLMPVLFGSVLEDADPREQKMMLAPLPPPVRLLLRTWGARHYSRYIRQVRGE